MKNTLLGQQLDSLLTNESNFIANLANASALIFESFPNINWAGFYLYEHQNNELILGPFQGKVACMHIAIGKGVCGMAFKEGRDIVVDNVLEFPGHIACDAASRSEIVVPLIKNGKKLGVLDIDSPSENRFTKDDRLTLNSLVEILLDHCD
ncbi:GAF domain-containing protein [Liquorilactobacillus mali]|uniref:GAF domain-containing protein n=1 Tax=Liquorilactobacillus mali KCTC 3596 = DSM 20444 TaxID=1046596 RepID=J0KZJ2_9LACO|nr:GAF domain-containing protein [Liquorilactobacillus mali]EJF00066.1 GAF domain-containing protein [Liquorilactobacillus mali KCTC 3596 = DSM 20444]KRN09024.1 GAF domain-containing protein [Liquorilactobacillus mali KCTC 3596 = DSM 20444]MDC7953561.1 GAF domain-containing protein [Liquorilactobacillus mali]MDV7758306.1 GAF domain-containing protein [Liquorilactobacillus mali]QFQ74488.1 GAF domain-containing protein [Liquorilactobacillus mali]